MMDGAPPGISLAAEDIQKELDRRRPGQSAITSPRAEKDRVEILSGVFDGLTTGTPIAMLIRNEDKRSGDYDSLKSLFRPGHADWTYGAKYGVRDWRGSGRASGGRRRRAWRPGRWRGSFSRHEARPSWDTPGRSRGYAPSGWIPRKSRRTPPGVLTPTQLLS